MCVCVCVFCVHNTTYTRIHGYNTLCRSLASLSLRLWLALSLYHSLSLCSLASSLSRALLSVSSLLLIGSLLSPPPSPLYPFSVVCVCIQWQDSMAVHKIDEMQTFWETMLLAEVDHEEVRV